MAERKPPPIDIEDTPSVTTDETLVPVRGRGGAVIDRWVEHDPKGAIERIETQVRMLEILRNASIRATYPSDWIVHTSRDRDGAIIRQVAYLQDCGAQRAGKLWGVEVGSIVVERENHPGGDFSYHMLAEAW